VLPLLIKAGCGHCLINFATFGQRVGRDVTRPMTGGLSGASHGWMSQCVEAMNSTGSEGFGGRPTRPVTEVAKVGVALAFIYLEAIAGDSIAQQSARVISVIDFQLRLGGRVKHQPLPREKYPFQMPIRNPLRGTANHLHRGLLVMKAAEDEVFGFLLDDLGPVEGLSGHAS
jgi:hypothetical protein